MAGNGQVEETTNGRPAPVYSITGERDGGGVWRIFKTDHEKVDDFRKGRSRQPDERFVVECELPDEPEAVRIAVGVRRAVASVGLVDPLFIHASDRFPEELGTLPIWDSMDWMSLVLALEEELGEPPPQSIDEWELQGSFAVKQLVQAAYEQMARRRPG